MNDIAAICQRNILIYEEKLRIQQEEQQNNQIVNGINQNDSNIIEPEDIELKDTNQSEDNIFLVTTDNENSTLSIQHNNEEIPQ
jgi:hypothetical protein